MTFFNLEVTGDELGENGQYEDMPTIRLENVDPMDYTCASCHRDIEEYAGDDWQADGTPEPSECPESEDGKHHPYLPPLSWVNTVRVSADARDDVIRVGITLGINKTGFDVSIRKMGDKYMLYMPNETEPGRDVEITRVPGGHNSYEMDAEKIR